jgi:hypothetical protein
MVKPANGRAETPSPPYIPWQTFVTFLRAIKQSGVVPRSIDNSVMSKLSGSDRGPMRVGFRFLGLIRDDNVTEDRLRQLIAALDTDGWKTELGDLISDAYRDVVSEIDLDTDSQSKLDQAFREKGGVEGSVNKKAVRFYLSALKDAGLSFSPHFLAVRTSKGRRAGAGKTSKRKPNVTGDVPPREGGEQPPADVHDIRVNLPSGRTARMWIGSDLEDAEVNYILGQIKGFLELKGHKIS